ncbi:MAG: bifunctional riboflavin kinase/FAD synthetase [Cyclobacteriaceae bacterium]|jgi:riboflavin kinase / FMN adenylyltransferase|nr:bifunctional riboflavin kinase/FAD synthetase [Cyclobacteriaceae bacterium]
MKIYEGLADFPPLRYAVVTSGTFDGVHLGHQKILLRLKDIALKKKGETVLITFWPHPRMVVHSDKKNLRLLSTFEEKVNLLEKFGVDHLVIIPFTEAFSQLSSQEFIQTVLVDQIHTQCLVIGYDHKFGKNREGSFEYLKTHAAEFGFEVEEISRQDVDDSGVSSTKIRTALEQGDAKTAARYLGRPYELNGKVVQGQQLGRSIGFPTANIQIESELKLLPKDGVYAVRVVVDQDHYPAMVNIGNRPTVQGNEKTIEAYLLGFEGDLYGKQLQVLFIDFIREQQDFGSLEALRQQLILDKNNVNLLL